MKKWMLCFCAAAVVVVVSANGLRAEAEKEEKARFRLFNAQYNSALIQTSKTTVFEEKKLFKIDTRTGETWMLIDVFKEGRDIKYWKKINEATDN